jgi:hypothetical protein
MNLQHVIARRFEQTYESWDWRDAALYALRLGIGDNPHDEDELACVYEGRDHRAVPSMCVTLGWPSDTMRFRARAVERHALVLDRGECRLARE